MAAFLLLVDHGPAEEAAAAVRYYFPSPRVPAYVSLSTALPNHPFLLLAQILQLHGMIGNMISLGSVFVAAASLPPALRTIRSF